MHVTREIVLPCPPDEAWAVLMNWERQADWMLDAETVEVMSEHREGVGVRLAVRTRLFGVPAFTEPMEVTVWDPPGELRIRHGGPIRGAGTWRLTPVEGGTRFTWIEEIRLALPFVGGLAARLYAPVMRALMRRAMTGLRAHVVATGPRHH